MKPLNSPADVDLSKHGVIEASAGSGKTYTIENLVVRILLEKKVSIDKILLVTYTEKAAGEMGRRIRENIANALAEKSSEPESVAILQTALDRFDEAVIQTIHGFCRRMLSLFALENGVPFATEVVKDPPLFDSCLRRLMRQTWPEKFGASFEKLLRTSGFEGAASNKTQWEKRASGIALSVRTMLGDRILPEPPENVMEELAEFEGRFEEAVREVLEFVGEIDPERLEAHPLYEAYSRLNINARTKGAVLKHIVAPLLSFLAAQRSGQGGAVAFRRVIESARQWKKFNEKEESFAAIVPEAWVKAGNNLHQVFPDLPQLAEALDRIPKNDPGKAVLAGLIHELREEVDRAKADGGLISFEDMILHLYSALQDDNPAAEEFLAELRARFHFALVDEFQDTDAAQWGIFERIFLESKSAANRLFVIGDPKQSIYRFRGADVQTYLRAKKTILDHPEGAGYTLTTNWRSTPEMIGAFNTLFADGTEWFRSESGIVHEDVLAPRSDFKKRSDLLADGDDGAAVTLVRFPEGFGLRKARVGFNRWIASEIVRLMSAGDRFQIGVKGLTRRLNLNDFCVLVGTKNEARDLQEVFGDRIPNSFYKKQGLYQSDEALHLSVLLRAIASPSSQGFRSALLTDFFRVQPERSARLSGSEETSHRMLFDRWVESAERREWSILFESILSDSRLSFFRDEAGGLHPCNERSWTNHRHLIQILQSEALRRRWDVFELVEALDRRRAETVEIEEDEDLHRIESETPKVQIMTLHVSKGLEFPVVFVVGGLTEGNRPKICTRFHDPEGGGWVYDMEGGDENKRIERVEEDDESSRLYYVGLTRAQHKLYLPYLSANEKGKSGPMSGRLRDSIAQAFGDGGGFVRVVDFEDPGEVDGLSVLAEPEADEPPPPPPDPLFPPENLDFSDRCMKLHSFTSLARHRTHAPGAIRFETEGAREPDEGGEALFLDPFEGDLDAPPILPKGERTGTMMHDLLETIDWSEVMGCDSSDRLHEIEGSVRKRTETEIEKARLAPRSDPARFEACTREALRWVWNALHLPLPIEPSVRLGEIAKADRIHEMEFHFPLPDSIPGALTNAAIDEASAGRSPGGFLTGFIDLAFRWNGRYYLLDWKTNSLPDYSRNFVERSMQENDYLLQHALYRLAFDRFLGLSSGDRTAAAPIGGILYLYLRGLDHAKPQHGVYWKSIEDLKPVPEIEKDLRNRASGEGDAAEEWP